MRDEISLASTLQGSSDPATYNAVKRHYAKAGHDYIYIQHLLYISYIVKRVPFWGLTGCTHMHKHSCNTKRRGCNGSPFCVCVFLFCICMLWEYTLEKRERRESEREGRKEKARERLCDSMRVFISVHGSRETQPQALS